MQHIAGHSSIHIIIQELMNLLHGNKFSPFFVNPFGSVLTNYVYKCTCMYRCWLKHMRWNNEVE